MIQPLFDNINLKKRRMNNSIKHRNNFLLSSFRSHRQAITNSKVKSYANTSLPSWQTAWECFWSSVKWASRTFCEHCSTFRIPAQMRGKPFARIAFSDFHLENLHCCAFGKSGSCLSFLLPASTFLEPSYFEKVPPSKWKNRRESRNWDDFDGFLTFCLLAWYNPKWKEAIQILSRNAMKCIRRESGQQMKRKLGSGIIILEITQNLSETIFKWILWLSIASLWIRLQTP